MEARMSAVIPRLGASLPLPPDLEMCRRVAEHAEILGYESLWIADTGAGPDAVVVAALAAGVTRRVRLGTAVVPIYTRALSVHAAAAGSVAQLAPGRFVLGLGISSETIVDAWGGVPFRRPFARMRETVAVLRQMLAGERVTFDGKTVRTRNFRLVSTPPGAPGIGRATWPRSPTTWWIASPSSARPSIAASGSPPSSRRASPRP